MRRPADKRAARRHHGPHLDLLGLPEPAETGGERHELLDGEALALEDG